jgi:hypothetical protein
VAIELVFYLPICDIILPECLPSEGKANSFLPVRHHAERKSLETGIEVKTSDRDRDGLMEG